MGLANRCLSPVPDIATEKAGPEVGPSECSISNGKLPSLWLDFAGMKPEERERMNWLCIRIQEEKDPKTFDQLVRELNDLLEVKHERIHPEHKTKPDKNPATH
jgi:hypothetical protein